MAETAPSPQQLPATWDVVAPTYAEDAWQWTDYVEEALRVLPIRPSDRVLDVATGPGTLALAAAPQAAAVDAVDFSPGMVGEVVASATKRGLKNLTAHVMDAQALSFADASFDAAFCMFGFFFFPDRIRAFHELKRVLRPGGKALIATWSPIERRPFMRIAFEAMAEALPQFPRPSKGDLQDPAECIREMSEAGFRDVSTRLFTASVKITSAEHYFDVVSRSGAPFAVMRKKLGEEAFLGMRKAVIAALEQRLPAVSAELSAEAIFTLGTG